MGTICNLTGVDKRGGKGYQEGPCLSCGRTLFISIDSEEGICATCVQLGFPKARTEINISDVRKAIEGSSLRRYRKQKKLSQDAVAGFLGISRMHYWRIEEGKAIGKNIMRKIENKLAQAEQSQ